MEPGDEPSTEQPASLPRTRNYRLAIFAALAVVALLVIGGAAYWLIAARGAKPAQQSVTTTQHTPTVVPDDTAAQGSSQQYTSNGKDLNLSFTYPSTWTVTPPNNSNQTDQPINVASPLATITSAGGQSVTGRVVLTIRPGAATLSELAGGKGTVGQASSQIAYSKPTSSQHQYPYLTFIHLAGGSDTSSAFEEVMITGITSFAKDQAVTSLSLSQLDPIISAQFYSCADQTCAANNSAALSITNDTWQNSNVTEQTLAIFQSIQIN